MVAAALTGTVVACSPATPSPSPSPSPSTSTSASPNADLTRPGAARKAVNQLVKAADGLPVIKVDLSATQATLSALKDDKVLAWHWQDGVVTSVESDIAYIEQATFKPVDYDLDDLGETFEEAARISGSAHNQQLQIVEYDHGEVVMTVTTRPESMPAFFRADGTPINRLDFGTARGFTEAIADATSGSQRVLAMGWENESGFWADTPGKEDGVITRRTRQARVPAWQSDRKANSHGPTFPPAMVDADVLAQLVRTLPESTGRPGADVSFEIARKHQMALPVITFDVGGQKVVTTLSGTQITDSVGG
ncbi:hypothetical protein FM114_10115 [Luteococcus japonicus LSP_Lj1]|uniref:Uncharacterized protein n=2 Tax=Luteococcus japonicus TaxID=33984 RepID=A0A1R4JWS0_9ACTN|nr:hypothetical protein FM114_10115 [Luteococcus japonicus LSP_Lj1]